MAEKSARPITPEDAAIVLDPLHPIVGKRSVYLIRHGHTKYNEQGQSSIDKIRGWIDVPLDSGGKEDAEIIGEMCRPLGIEVIVCSDLCRTVQTADIVAGILGLPVSAKTPAFRPWNLGDLQGRPTTEVLNDINHYINDAPDEDVLGGESFNTFKKRFLTGLQSVTDMIDKNRMQRVAVVTHFRGLKMADAWAEAGGGDNYNVDVDHFTKNDAKPGAILEVAPKPNGKGWEQRMLFRGFFNVGGKVLPAGAGS